jgi:hypothetical protein
VNPTDPLPFPDAPLVTESQSAFALVAVQVQPLAADTLTLPVPPLAPMA